MSVKYIEMAFKMPTNPTETLVLVALADYADDGGYCFPSYVGLMDKTKLAKATLAKTLFILEGAGFFTKKAHATIGEGRKANTYQLIFNASWFATVFNKHANSTRIELIDSMRTELIEKINELRKRKERAISSTLIPRKVQPAYPISSTREHEPSLLTVNSEPSLNTRNDTPTEKQRKKPNEVDQILSDFGITGQLAEDFKILRKTKKNPVTRTVMNGFAREAEKSGISVTEAVQISTERGWAGFKADWVKPGSNQTQRQGPPPEAWADTNFLQPTAAEQATGQHLSVLGGRK